MTDKQHYKLIEDFANDHSIAVGGGVSVSCSEHSTSMKPVFANSGMKYEDVIYLSDQIKGASSFLFWLRRNGFKITGGKNGKSKRRVHK